jgi:dimethylamine/trimethylamine dehydrogenase
MVTQRTQNSDLYDELLATVEGDVAKLPFSLKLIGDAEAPAIIAAAVYAGHRYATEVDEVIDIDNPMKHDRPDVGVKLPELSATLDGASQNTETVDAKYLETLKKYYEEEVVGEAWFRALADLFGGARREKMLRLAAVEQHVAAIVYPLIEFHGLTIKPVEELYEEGRRLARDGTQDWDGLIAYMRNDFPQFIVDFEALEAMAPLDDVLILKRMTEHEVAAIAFLEREAAGELNSMAPLDSFLAHPSTTAKCA